MRGHNIFNKIHVFLLKVSLCLELKASCFKTRNVVRSKEIKFLNLVYCIYLAIRQGFSFPE